MKLWILWQEMIPSGSEFSEQMRMAVDFNAQRKKFRNECGNGHITQNGGSVRSCFFQESS